MFTSSGKDSVMRRDATHRTAPQFRRHAAGALPALAEKTTRLLLLAASSCANDFFATVY